MNLVQWDEIKHQIETSKDIDVLTQMENQLEAMRIWAKQEKMGTETQNQIAEYKLRCSRKIGKWSSELEKKRGRKPEDNSQQPVENSTKSETLENVGLDPKSITRKEAIASIPDEVFEEYIAFTKAKGEELTTSGVVRVARKIQRDARPDNKLLPFPKDKYRTIVIDPPWPIEKIIREERPNQTVIDYPTMTIEEIKSFPINDIAMQDGCHVYMWTTHKFLPASFEIFELWGVKYQCLLTWVKNVGMTPYSFMYSTEHVLFGRIGNLDLLKKGKRLDFVAKATGHSIKPDEFYNLVREVSPQPRIDVFNRRPIEGFSRYGNEVELTLQNEAAVFNVA